MRGVSVLCVDANFDIDALLKLDKLPVEGEEYICEDVVVRHNQVGLYLRGFNQVLSIGLRVCFDIDRFIIADINELKNVLKHEEIVIDHIDRYTSQ